MIRLTNVSKTFYSDGIYKTVADNISVTFPDRGAVALLGRNGTGKSSLLKMIAGTMQPSSGTIEIDGSVSWPVGFAGSFHPDLSGLQNTRFVGRIYGVDTDELVSFVHDFSELGTDYYLPFRNYSQGMRARLGFAMSMGIDFDTYLIDEVTSVGDALFREKSQAILKERLATRSAIVVSHNMEMLIKLCDTAVLIENGEAMYFDKVRPAIRAYREIMGLPVVPLPKA